MASVATTPTVLRSPGAQRPAPGGPRLSRLRRAIGPVAVLLAWWVVTSTALVDHRQLATPLQVGSVFLSEARSGVLQANLLVSLERVTEGLLLGVAAGVITGCLTGMLRRAEDLVDPIVQMFRTVPFVALTSLFIVWFGIQETPKVMLVALACFFPVYLNTHNGIRNLDARLVEAARGFGVGRLGLVWEVVLPGALPQALLGLRIALGVSWLALVVAEQINAQSGVGYLLTTAQNNLDTAGIIAGVVTYAALGIVTDALVRAMEGRLLSWRRAYSGS